MSTPPLHDFKILTFLVSCLQIQSKSVLLHRCVRRKMLYLPVQCPFPLLLLFSSAIQLPSSIHLYYHRLQSEKALSIAVLLRRRLQVLDGVFLASGDIDPKL